MDYTKVRIPIAIDERGMVISADTITNPENNFTEKQQKGFNLTYLQTRLEELSVGPVEIFWVTVRVPRPSFQDIEADSITPNKIQLG